MKVTVLLLFSILINHYTYSQVVDTTKVSNFVTPVPGRNYSMTYGNGAKPFESYEFKDGKTVTFKKTSFINTEIVDKIIYLEGQECEALKSRDSLRLMTLWTRDFTLEEANTLVSNKGGIPYYTNLYRVIEAITPIDSVTVMSTGIEYQQQIGNYHSEEKKTNFFHIWTKHNGIWRLSTRRFQ